MPHPLLHRTHMVDFFVEHFYLVLAALISGGLLIFPGLLKGLSTPEVNTLAATQMINSRGALLIDVREPGERTSGVIPQARLMPMSTWKTGLAALVKELQGRKKVAPVILVCVRGWRSSAAGRQLTKAGIPEVFSLQGGFDAWQQAGLPTTKKGV